MFELIGVLAVLWVVWRIFKAIARTAVNQAHQMGATESLDLQSALQQSKEAEAQFVASVLSPGRLSASEQQALIDRVALLKDRVNQLSGLECGPAYRAKLRMALVSRASFGSDARSAIGTYLQGEREKEASRRYSSFDEWFEIFKQAAADANPHLSETTTDGTSLIDLMDLSPLRRGYHAGADPHELGEQFGVEFDLQDFLSQLHGKKT